MLQEKGQGGGKEDDIYVVIQVVLREIARKVYPNYYYIYNSSFERENGDKYYVFDIKRKVDAHYTRDTSLFVSFDGETCIEGITNDHTIMAYNNNNLQLEINNALDDADNNPLSKCSHFI